MRHQLLMDARQIAGVVRASEDNYDVALANNARLVAGILETRVKNRLPAKTAREAIERAIEAMSHGAKARQMLLASHAELAQINLRELAVGDDDDCPPLEPKGFAENVIPFGSAVAA